MSASERLSYRQWRMRLRIGLLRLHKQKLHRNGAGRTRRSVVLSAHMACSVCDAAALFGARLPSADDAIRVHAKPHERAIRQHGAPRAVEGVQHLLHLVLLAARLDALLAVLLGSGACAERCHERYLLAVAGLLCSLHRLLFTRNFLRRRRLSCWALS